MDVNLIGTLFKGLFQIISYHGVILQVICLTRSAGIESKFKEVHEKLLMIQAVLADVGGRQTPSVELWLTKLRHLAYQIDDVIDDLATEAMQRRLNEEFSCSAGAICTSEMEKFFADKIHALKYSVMMVYNLAEIKTKVRDIVDDKNFLGLHDNVEGPNRTSIPWQETTLDVGETSLVQESEIIGRKDDKEALVRILLADESSSRQNFIVVSIVGLGGIGKTTLCQLLYNDERVVKHFKPYMSWVRVSEGSTVSSICETIFKDVAGEKKEFENLNQVQVALNEKLSNKRFLIVLDNLWNLDYNQWELLQRPFLKGAPGSKVLVTTRKSVVESVMDSFHSYNLKVLSDEDALSLFVQHATSVRQTFDDVKRKLKPYEAKILEKCDGLPLALRILGRAFRGKSNEKWKELLNSEIWNSNNKEGILPVLMLSYYDLPFHLKLLFVYCSLFPKNYVFDKDELVLLSMAEGYLDESNDKSMENFGREGFEDLVSRSFFQHSINKKSKYVMHDLINDLARSVAKEFFLMLDNKRDITDRNEDLEKFRHISFINKPFGPQKKFKELQRAKCVRTFLAVRVASSRNTNLYVSHKVLMKIIPQLQFLRVLSLAYYNITEVPSSVCSLKHLRYINFSKTRITCLPEHIGDLYNLQSLLLFGCEKLSSLPTSTSKLINLRHLDIRSTPELKKMPLGTRGLIGLQTLSKVVIGEDDDDFKLSDLQGLLYIQGKLSIEGLHKVRNTVEAKDANLHQKEGIYDLELQWCDGSRDKKTHECEVLDGLRPFEKLRSLSIMYYMGETFPSWVGHSSFVCLTVLTLRFCKSCKNLPALGILPSLQNLFVGGMDKLDELGVGFHWDANSDHVAFRSLEVLKFEDMKEWVKWSTSGGKKVEAFPRLEEIRIINCPKLDVVTVELTTLSLRVLHVQGCSLAMLRSMVGMCSSISRLTVNNIKGLAEIDGEILKCLKAVEYLDISNCDELTSLWESQAVACDTFQKLQELKVSDCMELLSLGEEELQFLTNVEIRYCGKLKSYKCPKGIEKLRIEACFSLTSLSFPTMDDLPSTLKTLFIGGCYKMEVSCLLNNFLSSIEDLVFYNMFNQILLPEGCFVHLTSLIIYGCDNIESIPRNGYGFLPSHCLRRLSITNCKNLKSFPHDLLQSLASLEDMDISKCPNLDYPFPCCLWPPSLIKLEIGGMKKPISEWGKQNFPTSLVELTLYDSKDSGVVTFPKAMEEDKSSSSSSSSLSSFLLPPSLNSLCLRDFMDLESLSEGLQHLTCLQHLEIIRCPKLRDLPETLLPSLSSLRFFSQGSEELREKCSKSKKGEYWPIISQIPELFHP
ncbi:hypothetical protein R6Q59_028664 [Mikania micrantha]